MHRKCAARYRRGAVVELRADPHGNWRFADWRGECVGTALICVLAVVRPARVVPRFERRPALVQVVVGGDGAVSAPGGRRCVGGGGCSWESGMGETVELTAEAGQESTFRAWGGDCSGSSSALCRLVVRAPTEVTAAFGLRVPEQGNHLLSVQTDAISDPPGIDCPPTCSARFAAGTLVTLRLTRGGGSALWQGGCTGWGTRCLLSVDAPTTVGAVYPPSTAPPPPQTRIHVTVGGRGTVSGPSGLICGAGRAACAVTVLGFGSRVRLVARPRRGARFGGWRGECNGRQRTCFVHASGDRDVDVAAYFRAR